MEEDIKATFADDTAIIAEDNTNEEATNRLQNATDMVCNWTRKWCIEN